MTEKRFTWNSNDVMIDDNVTGNQLEVIDITEIDRLLGVMNALYEENQELRKDVIYWRHKALNKEPVNCKCKVEFKEDLE